MKLSRILLGLSFLVGATCVCRAVPHAGVDSPAKPPASDSDGAFPAELDALLSLLEERGLFDPADPAARRLLLQSVLDGLKCGATVVSPPVPAVAGAKHLSAFGLHRRLPGDVLYAQLIRVNREAYAQLKKVLASGGKGKLVPSGLILDLRASAEGDTASVGATTDLLGKVKAPIVLIIGHHTSGTSELLAIKLREVCGAVTVGASSTGCPFGYIPFPLPSGTRVLLPEPNGGKARPGAYLSGPLTPDVPITGNGDVSDRLPETGDQVGKDACIRRAAGLLVAVGAFSRTAPPVMPETSKP